MKPKWFRTMMAMLLSATMTCATMPFVAYANHSVDPDPDPNAVVEDTSITVKSVKGSNAQGDFAVSEDEDLSSISALSQTKENPAEKSGNETEQEEAEVEEGLDYILGRPMSEEEIAEQKALIPKTFPEAAELMKSPSVEKSSQRERDAVLPSVYDPRGLGFLTSVKNQGKWGTCWAHTSIAMAETSMAKKGISDVDHADLSERHLAYFVYHMPEDPLGNAVGDRTYLASDAKNYLEHGGSERRATHALANWVGFADESIAPYADTKPYDYSNYFLPENLDGTLAYQDRVHLVDSHWIAATDVEDIKQMVMEMGSASVSISFTDKFEDHYNIETGAFFSPQLGEIGHSGLVVGWDDEYSAKNFMTGQQPSSDGAWLVKNSWGQDWGDGGYYWISYEDAGLNAYDFIFYDVESADNYDHNYYYDGSLSLFSVQMKSGSKIANVYTAKASGTGAEVLEAVSLTLHSTNVDYAIQIYKDVTDDTDPESGMPVFVVPQAGTLTYSGYHTIPLIQPVSMVEGCRFSIVVTLTKSSGGSIDCAVDDTEYYKGMQCIAREFPKQSFYKEKGYRWKDTAAEGESYTMRIKGFTSDTAPVPVSSISIVGSSFTIDKTKTKKLFVGYVPVNAADTRLTWKSSDSAVAKVGADGTVTAVGAGTCTITAITVNGATASCQVTVPQNLQISETSATIFQGETFTLRATGASSTKMVWHSSDSSIVAVSANGKVTAKKAGFAIISVTAGGQTRACWVTVKNVLKISRSSISLKKGKKKSVVVTFFKEGDVIYKIKKAKYVSCSWGEFDGDKVRLTIRGLKKGKTTVMISNSFNKEKRKITVKVQ